VSIQDLIHTLCFFEAYKPKTPAKQIDKRLLSIDGGGVYEEKTLEE